MLKIEIIALDSWDVARVYYCFGNAMVVDRPLQLSSESNQITPYFENKDFPEICKSDKVLTMLWGWCF